MGDYIEKFDNGVKNIFSVIDQNEYLSGSLILFLVLYAAYAAPRLPACVLRVFDYTLVKLGIFFLIVYAAKKNATVAIIAAIGLMVTIHALNNLKINEQFMAYLQREEMRNVGQDVPVEMVMKPDDSFDDHELRNLQDDSESSSKSSSKRCFKKSRFRDDAYPQYENMKPDAYLSRYSGGITAFDSKGDYAKVE